jgi:hypothetical protein
MIDLLVISLRLMIDFVCLCFCESRVNRRLGFDASFHKIQKLESLKFCLEK